MTQLRGLSKRIALNWEGLLDNVKRKGTPDRVYFMELILDEAIQDALAERFDLAGGVNLSDPYYRLKKHIAVQRFCGYEYIVVGLEDLELELNVIRNEEGQWSLDHHRGPVTSWRDFENYSWPDPNTSAAVRKLEWYQKNLPDDMCIIGGLVGHFAEGLNFLMGYENLCFALYDQRDLVKAIAEKLIEFYKAYVRRLLEFDRVKMIWGADDMGFKTGTLISPDNLREFVLTGHKTLAEMCHASGRLYLLHSCGKIAEILEELINDVKIDAKHSFEDTIENVCEAKRNYGQRVSLIGGIDVDFLCRSNEQAIRRRVRQTLEICQPDGGYALGTGNSVADYVPLDNYLIMLDEGRLWPG